MFHTEGLQHFLELATQQQTVPTNYYLGWSVETLEGPALTMSDVDELSVIHGYARQPVAPGIAKAEGLLTLSAQVTDGDTLTLGTTTYRFKSILAQANDIQIGDTLEDTQDSLVKVINGTADDGSGGDCFAGTVSPHLSVEMDAFDVNDEAVVRARTAGTAGNSIATTETFTSDDNEFDDTTLGTYRLGGWDLVSDVGGINGRSLSTRTYTFTAVGGDWEAAKAVFLTTTPTGTSGPLIASESINDGESVTLSDGQSFDVALVLVAQPM